MKIFITGGAGYVGSELVPELLRLGHEVVVYDLFIYGKDVLDPNERLTCIEGDIRDKQKLIESSNGCDGFIHLACISNDPSFDLDPVLGKSINLDAFHNIIEAVKMHKPERFIYASSSSVYGDQGDVKITEEAKTFPITDYAKFKLQCEEILRDAKLPKEVTWTVIRPATVCGYGRRLRLDLVVNIFSIQSLLKDRLTVFGGHQKRANVHIKDMVRAYVEVLKADKSKVHEQIFNVGAVNHSLKELAEIVRGAMGKDSMEIVCETSNDPRSYHVNSDKIEKVLGFKPKLGIAEAAKSIKEAYEAGKIKDALNNKLYWNIKRMQELNLK